MNIGPHLIRLEAETYSLKEILDVLSGMEMELNVKDLSAVGFFSMSDSPINLSLLFFKKARRNYAIMHGVSIVR